MKKSFMIGVFLLALSNGAYADYIWSSAVPKEVHITPNGLVLLGDFDNTGVIGFYEVQAFFENFGKTVSSCLKK